MPVLDLPSGRRRATGRRGTLIGRLAHNQLNKIQEFGIRLRLLVYSSQYSRRILILRRLFAVLLGSLFFLSVVQFLFGTIHEAWVQTTETGHEGSEVTLPVRHGSGPVRAAYTKRTDAGGSHRDTASEKKSSAASSGGKPCFEVAHGRLVVPDSCSSGPHPIAWLMERAERDWQAKQAKQSKTLRQADQEYRRRYGRAPPQGFGDWWRYVKKHNVQLPDEYDQINADVAPFRAIRPRDLRSLVQRDKRVGPGHFRVEIKDGVATAHASYTPSGLHDKRLQQHLDLLTSSGAQSWIPDVTAVLSVSDVPNILISAGQRREMIDLSEAGEWWSIDARPDEGFRGFSVACPWSAPINDRNPKSKYSRGGKSKGARFFVADVAASQDMCLHPDDLDLHGTTGGKAPLSTYDSEQFVRWSLSKTGFHSDIMYPPTEQWIDPSSFDMSLPWAERQSKLLWRGSVTGAHYGKSWDYKKTQRARLALLTNSKISKPLSLLSWSGGASSESRSLGELNELWMDVKMTGRAMQCEKEDGTCDDMQANLSWGSRKTTADFTNYRYILDIDGNGWSARTQQLFSAGSVVIKNSLFKEWWNDRIQPWKHYVPVTLDFSDVYEVLHYFEGSDGHPEVAEKIAQDGLEWVKAYWRKEDLVAYTSRLYLEWARLLTDDRDYASFHINDVPASERD